MTRQENKVFSGDSAAVPEALRQHMEAVGMEAPSAGRPNAAANLQPGMSESINDMLARDFGVDIPVELVPLPSRGMLYSPEHPYHGRDLVEIRAMTAREEDILTSQALIKKGTVISELIRSCVVERAVNTQDLLIGDRNALMVAIRITGYGPQYDGEVQCSECGAKGTRQFDLSQLSIRQLTLNPVAPGVNEFEYTLPRLKLPVRFRFLTGRDEDEISKTSERQKKLGISSDALVTTNLLFSIISANGITDKSKLAHLIKMMPAQDSNALRVYMRQHEPGLDMKQECACPACGHTEEVSIPIGIKFLWPNAE
jgi:hypothetical protein